VNAYVQSIHELANVMLLDINKTLSHDIHPCFFLMKIWLLRGVLAMTHLFGLKPTPEIETRKKKGFRRYIYFFSSGLFENDFMELSKE
jgi:hypothetical protein